MRNKREKVLGSADRELGKQRNETKCPKLYLHQIECMFDAPQGAGLNTLKKVQINPKSDAINGPDNLRLPH